jgi:hypothetical protein
MRQRSFLSIVVGLTLFACTPAPLAEVNSPLTETIAPTLAPEETMTAKILYYEYAYYQMEGIPPYPSPYVMLDITQKHWVDMSDPNRFRHEESFRTREAEPKEGIERVVIGTGTGGVIEDCQTYDARTECTQKPITVTLDYSSWLSATTALGRKWLDNKDNPEAADGRKYIGMQTDEVWGDVHVFEKEGRLEASDLYPKYPMVEIMKFDKDLLRAVAWDRIVIDGDKRIVHSSARLVTWKFLAASEVPADLFSPNSK